MQFPPEVVKVLKVERNFRQTIFRSNSHVLNSSLKHFLMKTSRMKTFPESFVYYERSRSFIKNTKLFPSMYLIFFRAFNINKEKEKC